MTTNPFKMHSFQSIHAQFYYEEGLFSPTGEWGSIGFNLGEIPFHLSSQA